MSDKEELKAQGYIKLTNRETGRKILFNAAHVVLFHQVDRIAKDKSLKTEHPVCVKAFGEAPFTVDETIEEIGDIIKASGIDVYGASK